MTSNRTTVLDLDGLVALFRQVAGRKFIGPVDGYDCLELVFEDPDDRGGNLVSIYTEGRYRGNVFLGFVSRDLIADGYGTAAEDEGPVA